MRRFYLFLVILAATCSAAAGSAWWLERQWHTPLAAASPRTTVVDIAPGSTLRAAAAQLAAAKVVRSARQLEWLGRWQKIAAKIKPGEYQFSPAMTPVQVLAMIVNGQVLLHPVTIPEGFTVAETVARFAAAGFGSVADYTARLANPQQQRRHGVTVNGTKVPYEGYLFPDTYLFPRGTAPEAIINAMLKRLDAAFTPRRIKAMQTLGWNRHRTLTMASLIEKETALASERAQVSAVFHNRLQRRMRLQTDPTVIYAIPSYNGNIRTRDLKRDDPYNTYQHHGLPPGPIAAPGEAAIEAALFPAPNGPQPALYFVSRGDGSHVFSATVAAHNRAVNRYQRHR